MFLLVGDVVLGASNDTRFLNTLDCLVDSNTGEYWVGREAFPVAATSGVSANGSNGRAKLDVDALVAVLRAHVVTALVEVVAIPGRGNRHASRESRNIVSEADTQRGVLQTEGFESKSGNGTGVADALLALPTNTSGQVDFLEETKLRNEFPGLSVGIFPITESLAPRSRVAGRRCLARDCARVVERIWCARVGSVLCESEGKGCQEGR